MKKFKLSLGIVASILLATSLSFAKPPQNLAIAKEAVVQYHDSGNYEKDIKKVIKKATAYLKARVKRHRNSNTKPVIILDIDETALSNYADMKRLNFGGTIEEIRADEDKGIDPPIKATLQLYNYAKQNGIGVIFLTGRYENERQPTEENLRHAGYKDWDQLILRDGKFKKMPAKAYKTAKRKQLTEEGYDIILSIGDQDSDLRGGYADKTFKLPNPYYYIP